MTEDIKATRLSKAAREFNVGISTIVEFLHKKGFELDPNPNTKLPHEAYLLLVKEYSTDISVKKESEKLILKDLHRKKESVSIDDFSEKSQVEESEREEEVLVKDSSGVNKSVDLKTEIKKPDIKLIGKIDLEKTTKTKTEKPTEEPEPKPSKKAAESGKAVKKKSVPVAEDEEFKSEKGADVAEKPGDEIVTKETRPSKKDKKDKETGEDEVLKGTEKKTHQPVEDSEVKTIGEEEVLEDLIDNESILEQEADIVELFRPDFKKLSGPTVVGKIDLPVEEKKKPVPYQPVKVEGSADFKRKKRRKRISKEKEQVSVVKPNLTERREKTGK